MKLKYFQKIIDIIRGKNKYYDAIRGKFISDKYIIIPLGTFCLPRVITTLCHLKKRRFHGEKSYPFDLAFFNDFDTNVSLIENHFKNFYDGLKYDCNNYQYKNEKLYCFFNHDGNLTLEEFKERYNKRIENFYADICRKDKTIYFVLSLFNLIKKEQVDNLINTINTFRYKNFKIILLYCNINNVINYNSDYVAVIDDIDINSINTEGNWSAELSNRNKKQAKRVYNYLNKELKKIIK